VDDKKERFSSLGEQIQAVIRAGTPQGSVDERLLLPTLDLNTVEERGYISGLSESTPSEGGWLVQDEFINQLITPVWNEGLVPSKIKRLRMRAGSNSAKLPVVDESSRASGSRWGASKCTGK